MTIKELGDKLEVSPRTIRYDLDMIDSWIEDMKNVRLVRTPNIGITVDDPDLVLQKRMVKMSDYDYKSNQRERVMAIICLLLTENTKLSHRIISERLNMSIATVSKDMKDVKHWLEKQSINLVAKPNLGIFIESDERSIRRGVYTMLREIMDVTNQKIKIIKSNFVDVKDLAIKYYMEDIAEAAEKWSDVLVKCIKINYTSDKYIVSDTGFCDLYINLLITIARHKYSDDFKLIPWEEEYILARREQVGDEGIISYLREHTGIELTYHERLLLDGQLLSTKAFRINCRDSYLVEDIFIAKRIINAINNEMDYIFEPEESVLKEMAFHINALFYRLILGIPCGKNYMVEEIKSSFNDIFKVVEKHINSIVQERIGNIQVSEDEVAYITMYIIAALFKSHGEVEEKKSVIIVCGSNIATSEILKDRLKMLFSNINVIKTISYSEYIDSKDSIECDFILTTLPIKDERCIAVNPLLRTEDIHKLTNIFALKMQSIDINKYISATMNIIKEEINITPDEELRLSLKLTKTITREMNSLSYRDIPKLKGVLREDYVRVGVKARSWKEAIQEAGNLLLNKGKILQEDIDEMIKLKIKLGAYFVIDTGLAMPHLMIPGLKKPYVSIITLDKPVKFGHEYNDPVDIVIMLVSGDKSRYVGIIEDIIDIFNNEKIVQTIRNASSPVELIAACSRIP